MIEALQSLKSGVGLCKDCYLPSASKTECVVCGDQKRDKSSVYIVEKESDAVAIEQAKIFNGVYLVLGENVSPIGESALAKDRIKKFLKDLKQDKKVSEVVLALNNTREGNFTTMYVEEMFKKNLPDSKIKISRLGRGLSTGSELEYADEETLRNAFENRR